MVSSAPAPSRSAQNSAAPSGGGRREHPARSSGLILGILVFLVGVALIGYVFVTARGLFDLPPPPLPPPVAPGSAAAATAPSPALVLGQSLAHFLERLLVLFVMCVAGSLVAGQGVNLFFRALATHAPHPTAAPTVTTPPPTEP